MQPELELASALFNRRDYFAAHEAFEDLWRAASGEEKAVLKAITQVAVALHHHSTGNLTGARGVLARAAAGLASAPAGFRGIDIGGLCAALAAWQRHLSGEAPQPPFPRL